MEMCGQGLAVVGITGQNSSICPLGTVTLFYDGTYIISLPTTAAFLHVQKLIRLKVQ